MKHTLSLNSILKILPHRFPFLLIDKVLDYKKNKYLYALKNITENDFFLRGHFPNNFIFPGVLIVESVAQSSGLLLFYCDDNGYKQGHTFCLAGIKNTKFITPVYPGDQMIIKVFFKKKICNIYLFQGIVVVNRIIACKSTISLSHL
ncbi:3-hydroxyacyl-ACP dehydratase FabZ [Buchnera aphidicola]|uniref:3-hydroxyacyl-ACP dehydratase FabZ n=1 Tax=Buchnera aphidicola TaxID=9 RepID=UPI00094DCED2|nr:3-hydroxyacyl-ACP dehydratase FabZ [Buchnera aphidicola]